jgi:hypothetical protein
VARAQPSIASIVDLEEPTDLNVIPQILDELPVRTTALGVAVGPAAEPGLARAVTPAPVAGPRVEEPTPSGDWTITPGAAAITPRRGRMKGGRHLARRESARWLERAGPISRLQRSACAPGQAGTARTGRHRAC